MGIGGLNMGRGIYVEISSFNTCITQIQVLMITMDKLIAQAEKLPFAGSTVSTGMCAEQMKKLTRTELIDMLKKQKELMGKTVILLNNAKEKFKLVDQTLADEL